MAIGYAAGQTNQANNSIILNATGSALNQTTANTFTVAPIRNDVANVAQVMFYNATSKEVTYGNTISVAGNITGNYILGNGSQLTSINAVTVDITDTNGLTTVYYPTFVENRTTAQIARADVDLTYRTDDNLLTVGNVSVTGNITANNGMFTTIVNTASFTGGLVSVTGNITGGNVLTVGTVKTGSFVTGTIPAAAGVGAGARAFVTDADSVAFGNIYTGGSGNAVPVYSNGTNWYIG